MADGKFTPDGFIAELEALGVAEVRKRLATKIYSSVNNKRDLAHEWLRSKEETVEEEREDSRDASNRAQIAIARSAKNAAWIAAMAAIAAAIIAAVAIIISLVSLNQG